MRQQGLIGYGKVSSSLLIVFPLFLAYEIGLLFIPGTNGVDFVSKFIYQFVGSDKEQYLFAHLGMAGLFLFILLVLWQRGVLIMEKVTPLVLESCIYALTLGSFIIVVMDRLVGLELMAIGSVSEMNHSLIISVGAGVHEELVFRLGVMGIGSVLLRQFLVSDRLAVLMAALISAFLFALAHHYGIMGEPFDRTIFVYRCIAGLAFAAIFYYRSLAHVVYTHFLYDLYVMAIT